MERDTLETMMPYMDTWTDRTSLPCVHFPMADLHAVWCLDEVGSHELATGEAFRIIVDLQIDTLHMAVIVR